MEKIKFNDDWRFLRNGAGDPFHQTGEEGEKITIPHDASIKTLRNPDEPNGSGNGYFREENYVYTKKFSLPDEARGKLIYIEFEGVYQNAFYYVNGAFAGNHAYGYGNYYIDITKFALFEGENQIKVVVKNGLPSGRWYTGGGIYRDVNLIIAERMHIEPDGVSISTEKITENKIAILSVKAELSNRTTETKNIILKAALFDAGGNTVAENEMPLTMTEGQIASYQLPLYVDQPSLWSDETPNLYSYKVEIRDNKNPDEDIDHKESYDQENGTFGIRTISADPVNGLLINGKNTKLRGCCIHHDNGVTGTAEFPFAAEYRVKRLKEFGFNAIRSSHYPMSRRLLAACDKYGMYVMDEFADVWVSTKVDFDYGVNMTRDWEYDVSNLVRKDFNHPSVIMYSVGNEIPESGNKFDVAWGKKLADKIKALDSTRYTTNCLNLMLCVMNKMDLVMAEVAEKNGIPIEKLNSAEGQKEINQLMTEMGDIMDIAGSTKLADQTISEACGQVDVSGYNYAAGRYELDGQLHKNKIIVGSETFPRDLDRNWELVEKYPFVIGDFDWTGWDYLGEAGIGKIRYEGELGFTFYAPYPAKAAYCGDINLIGDPRPVAFWRQLIWGFERKPYIAVQPPMHHDDPHIMTNWSMTDAVHSWNFEGYVGKPVTVEVYSDADEVELMLNGKSLGRKNIAHDTEGVDKKYQAHFECAYEPGELKAINYRNGAACEESSIVTASNELHLEAELVTSDRISAGLKKLDRDTYEIEYEEKNTELLNQDNVDDLLYIELYLKDENGILNPDQAVQKTVSVSISDARAEECIEGFGSADPESEENFFDTRAKTFEGRLRVAVRIREKGKFKFSVLYHK